eukprot:m.738299 g.738299  ORF g.738299 m.738299 type:complete len:965 (-) comp23099_c0_seq7:224-3118(-)
MHRDSWCGHMKLSAATLLWQPVNPNYFNAPPVVHSGAAVATQLAVRGNGTYTAAALWHFGGVPITYTPTASLWAYVFTNGAYDAGQTQRWVRRTLWPQPLSPRSFHTAVLVQGYRMVVYGGRTTDGSGMFAPVDDNTTMVALDLRQDAQQALGDTSVAWTALAGGSGASPPVRYAHAAAALGDAAMVVVGGINTRCSRTCVCNDTAVLGDAWVYSAADGGWYAGPVLPRGVFGHALGVTRRASSSGDSLYTAYVFSGATTVNIVAFQGYTCGVQPGGVAGTLWRWEVDVDTISRGAWVEVTVSAASTAPSPRYFPAVVNTGTKMLLYGGTSSPVLGAGSEDGDEPMAHNTTWMFQTDPPEWQELNTSGLIPHRVGASAVFGRVPLYPPAENDTVNSAVAEKLMVFGGQDYFPTLTDIPSVRNLHLGCNPGSNSSDFATTRCSLCPLGTYAATAGATLCTQCTSPTTTIAEGSMSLANCTVCPSSYCNNHGVCTAENGKATCDCHWAFDDGATCKGVQVFVLGGVVFSVLLVIAVAAVLLKRMRRRILSYHIRSSRYQKLLEFRDEELTELQRAWLIDPAQVQIEKKIAEGTYGEVSVGVYQNFPVAVKMIRKAMQEWDLKQHTDEFEREIRLLRQLRHANIVFFYGAGTWHDGLPFFVTELCSRGSLRDILDDAAVVVSVERGLGFAADIASGMEFLHELTPPRMHRDLKAANALVASDWAVKLADFGSARLLQDLDQQDDEWVLVDRAPALLPSCDASEVHTFSVQADVLRTMSAGVGTALWLAPEIMTLWTQGADACHYGRAADTYSYGIVMFEVMTRLVPFQDDEEFKSLSIFTLRRRICEGARPGIPIGACGFPAFYVKLMQQCWNGNPDVRPSFKEIVTILSANSTAAMLSDDSDRCIDDDEERFQHRIRRLSPTQAATRVDGATEGTAVERARAYPVRTIYEDDTTRDPNCQSIVSEL